MAGVFPGFPAAFDHPCRVDVGLDEGARRLLQNCLSPASWRAYAAGQVNYRRFCERFGLLAVPASRDTIVYYLADQKRSGVAVGTARQRLAAVRHLHLQCGASVTEINSPLVRAALRGYQARGGSITRRSIRPGITVEQLRTLKTALGKSTESPFNQRCLWAACAVAFYGGLRASEYISDQGRGLRRKDIKFASDDSECVLELKIQKNHQFGAPMSVYLPNTGTSTCPVRALRKFCGLRDVGAPDGDALFRTESGAPLSRRQLSAVLKTVLGEGYSTHSLRIGLATGAAAEGVPDTIIQQWEGGAARHIRAMFGDIAGRLARHSVR